MAHLVPPPPTWAWRRLSSFGRTIAGIDFSTSKPRELLRQRALREAFWQPDLCRPHRFVASRYFSLRHLPSSSAPASSGSGSSIPSFSPVSWWRGRQEKKEEEKYRQRIQYMAAKEAWTIGDMRAELDEIVTSWASKLPGLRDNKETTVAKKMHKALSGLVDVLGKGATDADLDSMTRKQKLEAAVKGGTTVEEINLLTQQFQSMALMHRILRNRLLESKPIPTTAEGMQALLQTDGSRHLSPAQKERLKGSQLQRMRKIPRRR